MKAAGFKAFSDGFSQGRCLEIYRYFEPSILLVTEKPETPDSTSSTSHLLLEERRFRVSVVRVP